jgi:hypothetical protein
MRITGMRAAAILCAACLIAAVGATGLAGAKLKKKKVQTDVTLNTAEDPADPAGKTHNFTGFLEIDPEKRETCLKREVILIAIKGDKVEQLATANSDASGEFDLGSHKVRKDESYVAGASKKKKRKKNKKIICKPGESEAKSF